MNRRFYGTVKEGKITFPTQTRGLLDEYTSTKFKEGDVAVVIVGKPEEDVTLEQYRYLYACVYEPLAEHLGNTVEEIDEILKYKYLCRFKGTTHEFVQGKSELTREEMAKYIDFCIKFAAEQGVIAVNPLI